MTHAPRSAAATATAAAGIEVNHIRSHILGTG